MRTLAHIGIPKNAKPENGIYLADAKLYITDPPILKTISNFFILKRNAKCPKS